MVDYNYLTNCFLCFKPKIILFGGRAISRRNLFIQIFSELWPILEWNYIQDDIGFNSKKIKNSDRKARRVFYQSFRLYKNTTSRPDQKLFF